ncbi:Neural cell adhesion molecule L1 [Stylophora pistillata]|uniref:Neural cell adhesion molecule L1 n=1 Tax=Stylophora pistillata TaxID=50429 RepID=A0A2B4R4S8_STYPI|nr:Neural cell adhesion molecule L1 [Stylophora pistillata]
MNSSVRKELNKRYKLLLKAQKTPMGSQAWIDYKKARNECTKLLRLAESNHWLSKFNETTSPRDFWKTVRSFEGKRTTTNIVPIKDSAGVVHSDDTSKANNLNSFFVSVGKALSKSTQDSSINSPYQSAKNNGASLYNIALNRDLLKSSLRCLKPGKASGPDYISSRELRLIRDAFLDCFMPLAQRSILECKFHSQWKQAQVKCLHKKGNTLDCGNYKPITFLSIPGKLLENVTSVMIVIAVGCGVVFGIFLIFFVVFCKRRQLKNKQQETKPAVLFRHSVVEICDEIPVERPIGRESTPTEQYSQLTYRRPVNNSGKSDDGTMRNTSEDSYGYCHVYQSVDKNTSVTAAPDYQNIPTAVIEPDYQNVQTQEEGTSSTSVHSSGSQTESGYEPLKGSDRQNIFYWGTILSAKTRRRRRAIPSYANSADVKARTTSSTAVLDLKPYTSYKVAIKAFNSGGKGPATYETYFDTLQDVPGPPSDVKVYPFALYILVTWKPPVEPNGIIKNYQAGSAKFKGSEPKDTPVEMTELETSKRRYLIGKEVKQEELTNYVVEIQAKTEPGYGASVRIPTKTVKVSGHQIVEFVLLLWLMNEVLCLFREEKPPPYQSQSSLDNRDSYRDSLDDYGEGPQFKEDGSFIEEYGDEKKQPPDEKDQSAFATFV